VVGLYSDELNKRKVAYPPLGVDVDELKTQPPEPRTVTTVPLVDDVEQDRVGFMEAIYPVTTMEKELPAERLKGVTSHRPYDAR